MLEGPKQVRRQTTLAGGRSRQKREPVRELEKKQPISVGLVVTATLGVVFLAYAFNAAGTKDGLDDWFAGLNTTVHRQDALVGATFVAALPYLGAGLALFLAFLALRMMGLGAYKAPKKGPAGEELSVHQFAEVVKESGVGAKVAREAYRMLLTDHEKTMRSAIGQPMVVTAAMFEELVRRSGGVVRGRAAVEEMRTPLEMMQAAERCSERAALERRMERRAVTASESGKMVVPLPLQRRFSTTGRPAI